jgi:hypothetical protein
MSALTKWLARIISFTNVGKPYVLASGWTAKWPFRDILWLSDGRNFVTVHVELIQEPGFRTKAVRVLYQRSLPFRWDNERIPIDEAEVLSNVKDAVEKIGELLEIK